MLGSQPPEVTNLQGLLVEPAPGDGDEAMPLPAVTVGGVELQDAALDFSDLSLPLPFEAAIRQLDGSISTLATTSQEPATIDLAGQVNEFGEATIAGAVNAWAPKQQSEVQMAFRNLEMGRLTPYTVQFAGYAIESGKLDLDLLYRVQASELQGANDIVIRELTLGDKVDHPDAGNLPLGLAVALLKDADGVIDIDLPVEGNVDDPEFRIGGVVMTAIGNLIARAVTAPFRLLGSLIGVDSEDFGTLAFSPGSAELSPPDKEQLLRLNEALAQRPELRLEVTGRWHEPVDAPALAEQALESEIATREASLENADELLTTERQRRVLEAIAADQLPTLDLAALQASHSTPPPDEPEGEPALDEPAYLAGLREELLAAQGIGPADLEALAEARAAAIMSELTSIAGEQAVPAVLAAPAPADEDSLDDETRDRVPVPLGVAADN